MKLRASDWQIYQQDPLPGWCRRAGALFDVPTASLSEPPKGIDVAICSVSFDSTASTRIGARHGPSAIREASLGFAAQAASRRATELRNMRDGSMWRFAPPRTMHDFGDLHVYPSDPSRQVAATASETYRIAAMSNRLIALGGEHTLSYPVFCGVGAAQRDNGRKRLGYVQIDHHFDFGDHSVLHGRYYHGSNARRISELLGNNPAWMGFFGQGDFTGADQYKGLIEQGAPVRGMADIQQHGLEVCLRGVLDAVAREVDGLYVSVDIDVCDVATACGTGHVTVGGLSARELMTIPAILQDYPVLALDMMEVNPLLDPSGATATLAARFLFEYLLVRRARD